MEPNRFRIAINKLKDHSSIGLARVSSKITLPDLEVAIVRATSHEDYPADDRHIRDIIILTSDSQPNVALCISTISRRLNNTRNWIVALKALIVIQRLLQDGDPAYEQEIYIATRRGTRLLNMTDFRDMSTTNSWDYSAFIRRYALYLDEELEYRMQGRRGKYSTYLQDEEAEKEKEEPPGAVELKSPVDEKTSDNLFSRIQHLMQILDRFLSCKPTGLAKNNRIVMVALYPIVKQSFEIYYDLTDILSILIDRFKELEISDCVKVYEIFRRAFKQYDELDYFYDYCKSVGLARTSEYPDVEKISQKRLDFMDKFIREKSLTNKPETKFEEQDSKSSENRIKKTQDEDTLNMRKHGLPVKEQSDGGPSQQPSMATGSASSVAVGSAGKPSSNGGGDQNPVAEMEKKR